MSPDRIALATAAFAAALMLAAPAAQAQPIEPGRFAGVYEGQLFAAGSYRAATTALRRAGGALSGDYSFAEPSGEVLTGELRDCSASGRKLVCRWSDVYGVGDLEMDFAADFASFRGRWRADNAKRLWNSWTGRRRATS